MKNSTKKLIGSYVGAFVAGAGIAAVKDGASTDNKNKLYIGYGSLGIGLYLAYAKAMEHGIVKTLETLDEQGAITNLTFDKKGNGTYRYLDLREIK